MAFPIKGSHMWQNYSNALISAFGLAGLGFGIGKLVILFGERAIERRHGSEGVRDVIARRADRILELKELDGGVEDVLRQRKAMERQIEESRQSGERLVRLIGEELQNSPCYVAMVVNKYVGTGAVQQSQHALVDPSWAQPQMIEVWARSMAEARMEIERRYPPAFGYAVTRMQEFLSADTPIAKAG